MKLLLPLLLLPVPLFARATPALPDDPHFDSYQLAPAPEPGPLMLEKGDKLAICGDSITEQKRYSLILETYLAACRPDLEVECRQFGWSGERADGFLRRMKNDVLRFEPDVATTCYGMNDFRYVPFDERIAAEYRRNQTRIAEVFAEAGCDLLLGSPGIIDSVPHWVEQASGTQLDLNLALARFRDIDIEVAGKSGGTRFADVFRPMLIADWKAKNEHGPEFKVAGKDGVHPGWAGHVVMAYAFLKGLGFDGDLGTITIAGDEAQAGSGHEVKGFEEGSLTLVSTRLPFSAGPGDPADDDSIRAGLELVPFDAELNRLTFRMSEPAADRYRITWGGESHEFEAGRLEEGINLAAEFVEHPLLPAFQRIRQAVAAKQDYETRQIKSLFHGPEGRADMEATVALTEKVHERLVGNLKDAREPVEHVIRIEAVESGN